MIENYLEWFLEVFGPALRVIGGAAIIALAMFGCVALTGCKSTPFRLGAVDAHTDARCFQACVSDNGDTGVRWDGDPNKPDMIDVLADSVVIQLATKLRQCETSRKACVQSLERLEASKVIRK